jgi:chromosomal replication initiation ATPase DnaA
MAHMNTKVSGPAPKIKHKAIEPSPLNPQLTFGTFIIGESNTLAHAAAKQVATTLRGEAVVFNQLYIHARVGMGKTHLLQGIVWVGNQIPRRRILYLTAETLMHEFLARLRLRPTSRVECPVHSPRLGFAHRRTIHDGQNATCLAKSVSYSLWGYRP